ncbi:hypothetical protein B0O99DRAFT_596082 [Bisporella sp. PMI_857]|nr:hypothetical protein B0O99DRAFT_596082 [Bisporella sp. PMI_857]
MFRLENTTLRGRDLQEARARASAGYYASLLTFLILLVKGWTAPSTRRFSRHHFALPTFLLSPAKARYPDIQARWVHKKASSEEDQGKQRSDSSTDNRNNEDSGSSSASAIYFLFLFYFILGARRRREGRQDKSPVDVNGEVHLEGTGD